ncbi:hypothetical protein [Streptomyces sp. NPDC091371]|uniref:hypothetical protein n=1 Tax=Streptomyces sp. NPDC091371 TaxID=3155303 RepID=UPI00343BEF5E
MPEGFFELPFEAEDIDDLAEKPVSLGQEVLPGADYEIQVINRRRIERLRMGDRIRADQISSGTEGPIAQVCGHRPFTAMGVSR